DAALPSPLASSYVVHFALRPAGVVVGEPKLRITPGDGPFTLQPAEDPGLTPPARFLLADQNGNGAAIGARLHLVDAAHLAVDAPTLTPDSDAAWSPALQLPVAVYGNVGVVSRGQSVPREVLGSGDGSVPSQSFVLQKKPLTYLASPDSPSGVRNTLQVAV